MICDSCDDEQILDYFLVLNYCEAIFALPERSGACLLVRRHRKKRATGFEAAGEMKRKRPHLQGYYNYMDHRVFKCFVPKGGIGHDTPSLLQVSEEYCSICGSLLRRLPLC